MAKRPRHKGQISRDDRCDDGDGDLLLFMLNSGNVNSTGVRQFPLNHLPEDALRLSGWTCSIYSTSHSVFCKIRLWCCFNVYSGGWKVEETPLLFPSQSLVGKRFSICCSGPKAVYSRKQHTGGLQQQQQQLSANRGRMRPLELWLGTRKVKIPTLFAASSPLERKIVLSCSQTTSQNNHNVGNSINSEVFNRKTRTHANISWAWLLLELITEELRCSCVTILRVSVRSSLLLLPSIIEASCLKFTFALLSCYEYNMDMQVSWNKSIWN